MPKRQRNNNPLQKARKGSSDKADEKTGVNSKAKDLWHRKSGAGYHLFLSYYGSQPAGVVACFDDFATTANNGSTISSLEVRKKGCDGGGNQGQGMSRAAKKRRQKKKGKTSVVVSGDGCDVFEPMQQQQEEDDKPSNASTQPGLDVSHPLVQAFKSQSNTYPHLVKLVGALSSPLPLTLRFRKTNATSSSEVKEVLKKQYSTLILPVSYDPSNSIYQSTPTSSLSKSNLRLSPHLKELVVESSMNGTLARQELGSMLPVLTLHATGAMKGGSKVLDLCASPGSKTMQALEIVASSAKKGRVIANDVHSGRLDSLREALGRSGLEDEMTARVTYTNYDASVFPLPKSGKLFDAIICDVPCSGDGTIRKDKHILPMWTPHTGNELHSLQAKILVRALELVKVGGVVCYSTCSLNPVEDEAVVASALTTLKTKQTSAEFQLMEWPEGLLPGFVRRPGITNWRVAFYDQSYVTEDEDTGDFGNLTFCKDYEEATEKGLDDAQPTFWCDATNNKHVQLDRCTRLLPQDNDSGGFFLVLIKKIA